MLIAHCDERRTGLYRKEGHVIKNCCFPEDFLEEACLGCNLKDDSN